MPGTTKAINMTYFGKPVPEMTEGQMLTVIHKMTLRDMAHEVVAKDLKSKLVVADMLWKMNDGTIRDLEERLARVEVEGTLLAELAPYKPFHITAGQTLFAMCVGFALCYVFDNVPWYAAGMPVSFGTWLNALPCNLLGLC